MSIGEARLALGLFPIRIINAERRKQSHTKQRQVIQVLNFRVLVNSIFPTLPSANSNTRFSHLKITSAIELGTKLTYFTLSIL
jgi:hypothetical protein